MTSRRLFLASCAATTLTCRRPKAEGFPGYAFVVNRAGKAVAVVDLGAFAVTRHIRLEGSPSAVVSHPVEPAVYVLTPDAALVHEVGTDELSRKRSAAVPRSSVAMKLSPDGAFLWILCREARQLTRLAIAGFRTDLSIALPGMPSDFDISPDGSHATISLEGVGVAIASLVSPGQVRVSRVGSTCGVMRYRKDGRVLLVGNTAERLLTFLDATTGKLLVRLPVAVVPEYLCSKADGGQVFLAGRGMDAVVTVYPYKTEVGSTTLAGHTPGFLAASNTPDYLFAANPGAGDVTVIDIQTQRVIAVVTVGKEPSYITVTPDDQYALVLNRASGDIAVIRIAKISGRRTRFAPLFTMIPVGSEPVAAVVRAL